MDEMQEKFSADADNAMATGISPITGIQALQARDIDTSASAVSRADRIRNLVEAPDFEIPEYEPLDSVVKNYHMTIDRDVARDMVQRAGIHRSAGAQTAVAIENALMDLGGLGDQMDIAFGNIENYVSGGTVGKDLQDIAYKSIDMRMADMSRNADSVGGIESFMAKLAAGGLSMVELALVSAATYGAGGLAQMGVQAMGEGTYNDMKAYADKHDGSIERYVPEGADIALNFANALLQAGIEAKFGVASPRFLHGASRGLVKEGLSGALQESSQSFVSDINEVLKGNQEWQSIVENAHGYIEDAVIGGLLQGTLGAATHYNAHAKAVNDFSNVFAWARGRKTPNKQDIKDATSYVNAKENEDAVAMTEEFKHVFDEQTGTGALYKKTLKALNEAVAKHEDWADLDETQKAQRLMQIAQQETLHALRDSMEKGKSIESHAMNEITYKDGAIWIEGLEPEIGDKAVAFSRILAERQSGLNEIQAQIDGLNQEIKQTKQELAEAKKASKDALAEKLQAQVEKQEARAQKRKAEAEKIREQIAKMERQSAKRQAKTRVDSALKKAEKSVAKKSLKAEREAEKKTDEHLTLFQSDMEKQAEPNRLLQEQQSLADENARLDEVNPEYTGETINIDGVERTVYNSNGDRIAKSEPALRNFWAWFGDSKVVDEQGRPLVVYHGTSSKFDTFSIDESGKNTGTAIYGQGFYFTTDKEVATKWGAKRGEPIVMGVYVKLENPNMVKELEYPKDSKEKGFNGVIAKVWGGNELEIVAFEPNQIKSVNNRGTFSPDTGNIYYQGSVKGKGDTYRGGFDEKLKRIVLGEKSDLSTIQHEFAHYWVQNNFKWARSGLATADWLDKWRKVEDWLGIRPDDRFLSREASERFAKAYERFVIDGREVPELAWAYQGFSDFYNEIYEDELKAEYFDLEIELSQDVVDWFNAIRDAEPVKRAQVAVGRIGRELARRGNKIVDKGADGTITVSESDGQGGVQTLVFVPQEKAEESKYFESSGKETESGISKTMRDVFGEEVAPQQYVKMDKDATVANADVQVKADRQTAIDKMLDEKTDAIDRAALYNALVKDAVDNNDASALMALSGKEMSDFGTKLGQAVALLDVDSETGFDVAKVARAVSEAKGEMTTEQLDQALKEIDLDSVELTESDATALENETECQL